MQEPNGENIASSSDGGGNITQQMQQMEKLMQMQLQMMKLNMSGGQDTASITQGNTLADTWLTQEGLGKKQVRQVKVPKGIKR